MVYYPQGNPWQKVWQDIDTAVSDAYGAYTGDVDYTAKPEVYQPSETRFGAETALGDIYGRQAAFGGQMAGVGLGTVAGQARERGRAQAQAAQAAARSRAATGTGARAGLMRRDAADIGQIAGAQVMQEADAQAILEQRAAQQAYADMLARQQAGGLAETELGLEEQRDLLRAQMAAQGINLDIAEAEAEGRHKFWRSMFTGLGKLTERSIARGGGRRSGGVTDPYESGDGGSEYDWYGD